jgi:lipopolysaccharide transport system permease protein
LTDGHAARANEIVAGMNDVTGHLGAKGEPLIVVDAEKPGAYFQLSEIWRYRDLLYFLIWRDIKIRYKQTVLGAAWAIIQPLFAMVLFTLFFGRLAHIPSDNMPYSVFAYAGLLPWTFFTNAVISASNSLVGSTSLITKVYFPRWIIPAAAVAAGLLDLVIAFFLLVGLMIYFGVSDRKSVV